MAKVWFSVHNCSTTKAYVRQGSVQTKRKNNAFIRSSSAHKLFFCCHSLFLDLGGGGGYRKTRNAYNSLWNLNSYFERVFECVKQFREIVVELEDDPNIGQSWKCGNVCRTSSTGGETRSSYPGTGG
jgi:hypothetical protein